MGARKRRSRTFSDVTEDPFWNTEYQLNSSIVTSFLLVYKQSQEEDIIQVIPVEKFDRISTFQQNHLILEKTSILLFFSFFSTRIGTRNSNIESFRNSEYWLNRKGKIAEKYVKKKKNENLFDIWVHCSNMPRLLIRHTAIFA